MCMCGMYVEVTCVLSVNGIYVYVICVTMAHMCLYSVDVIWVENVLEGKCTCVVYMFRWYIHVCGV